MKLGIGTLHASTLHDGEALPAHYKAKNMYMQCTCSVICVYENEKTLIIKMLELLAVA